MKSGRSTTLSMPTPIVIDSGEGRELVVTCRGVVRAFDPAGGRELWHWRGAANENYVCPSLSFEDGVVFGIVSHSEAAAIRCGGRGDVTGSHTGWKVGHQLTVASPVLHDGRLFAPDDSGSAIVCKNAATGETENRIRLDPGPGRGVYASPLVADGRLYLVSRFGGAYVFRAGPEPTRP